MTNKPQLKEWTKNYDGLAWRILLKGTEKSFNPFQATSSDNTRSLISPLNLKPFKIWTHKEQICETVICQMCQIGYGTWSQASFQPEMCHDACKLKNGGLAVLPEAKEAQNASVNGFGKKVVSSYLTNLWQELTASASLRSSLPGKRGGRRARPSWPPRLEGSEAASRLGTRRSTWWR